MMHPNDLPQPRPVYERDPWPTVTHRARMRIPSDDDGLADSDVENDDGLVVPVWALTILIAGLSWLAVGVAVYLWWPS